MPSDVLRCRVDHDVGAMLERVLPEGAKEGVVHRNGDEGVPRGVSVGEAASFLNREQRVRRVRWCLEEDHGDLLAFDGFIEFFDRHTWLPGHAFNAESAHDVVDEVVRTPIERGGVHQHRSGP